MVKNVAKRAVNPWTAILLAVATGGVDRYFASERAGARDQAHQQAVSTESLRLDGLERRIAEREAGAGRRWIRIGALEVTAAGHDQIIELMLDGRLTPRDRRVAAETRADVKQRTKTIREPVTQPETAPMPVKRPNLDQIRQRAEELYRKLTP